MQDFIGRPRCRRKDNNKIDLEHTRWQDVDWIHMALNADHWRTLEYTVMNHWLLEMREVSSLTTGLLAFQEGLRSLKSVV
jgi:hypothetical protein